MKAMKRPSESDINKIADFLSQECRLRDAVLDINGQDSWVKITDKDTGKIIATVNLWQYRKEIGLARELFYELDLTEGNIKL